MVVNKIKPRAKLIEHYTTVNTAGPSPGGLGLTQSLPLYWLSLSRITVECTGNEIP